MKKFKIISAVITVIFTAMVCTEAMAMTTSREEPMQINDKEYRHSSFTNGEVLLDKKNGRLPAMGWNSWNAFGSGNTETLTKAMADKITELGLDKLGYEYVVLDDGCYKSERVDGKLANNEKFPSGFKSLSDYMHSKGLKFGMYNDIGTNLCAGAAVGTCGYEDIDAKTYLDWGVDFLKVDNCYYLWDNATFSNAANAKYTYAPNIRSASVSGDELNLTLNAVSDGVLEGRGAVKNTNGNYVTNIGTYDGTNVGNTPVGDQSGELLFNVNVPSDGEYSVKINYATGAKEGVGSWLQLAIGDSENETVCYDGLLDSTSGESTFKDSQDIKVQMKQGDNVIRIMNHRRQENTLYSYAALLDGLNKANPDNDVLLSICEWGKTQPQDWGYKIGSSWRILNDISFRVGSNGNPGSAQWSSNNTASITSQYSKAVIMDEYAGLNRGWNDPDMFVIGMNGITETMSKTQMTMWSMMNSPLMLGMDLRRIEKGDELYNIIANSDIIALNQDALGVQSKRVYCSLSDNPDTDYVTNIARTDILAKPLANGDVAISFINVNNASDNTKRSINVDRIIDYIGTKMTNSNEFKNAQSYYVKDLWTKEAYITNDKEFSVSSLDACDNVTLRITPIYNSESMKQILKEKIDYSKNVLSEKNDLDKKLFIDANDKFNAVITNAENIYNQSSADINSMQTVYFELVSAEDTLNEVYAKYNELGNVIKVCDSIKNNADRYEQNTAWDLFCKQLENARNVYETAEDINSVDNAVSALNEAKGKLSRILGDGFNPTAWYVFDSEHGVSDISGNGNNAKLVNSGAVISENSTLSLNENDENNGYMQLPDGLLANADNFSFTAWVKIDEARQWARIFDFGKSSTEGYMFLCPFNGSNMTAYAITSSNNKNEQSVSTQAPELNKWVHMAVVQESDTVKLYIDGKAAASQSITNNPKNSISESAKYYIGKSQFDDPYFKGEIMDLRVYDKAVTSDEIADIMSVFNPNPEASESISINNDFSVKREIVDNNDEKTRTIKNSVTNISGENRTVYVMFSKYSETGELKNIKLSHAEIENGKKYVFSDNAYSDSNTKVLIWTDDMEPITEVADITPYTEPETVWSVIRPNEDNVSYIAGNCLSIKTSSGDLWGTADGTGTAENIYLTDVKGDFDAYVTLKYKPSSNYQRGAIIAYTGDGNHVTVMRRFHSGYNGNVFMTTMNTNGKAASENVYTADTGSDECMLRLTRSGSTFKGYFSTDKGSTWNELETREQSVLGSSDTIKIGFYASNGEFEAESESVIFENFTINRKTVTFNNVE